MADDIEDDDEDQGQPQDQGGWEPVPQQSQQSDQPSQVSDDGWEPVPAQAAADDQGWEPAPEERKREPQSIRSSLLRGAAHSVIPGAIATAAGVATAPLTPFVSIPVAMGAGYLASKAQEAILGKVAPEEEEAYQQASEEHPVYTGIGEVAGLGPSLGIKGASLIARAASGLVGGTIDYALSGDPYHAAGVAAGSTLLGKPRAGTEYAGQKAGSTLLKNQPDPGNWSTFLAKRKLEAEAANAQKATPGATAENDGGTSMDPMADRTATRNQSEGPSPVAAPGVSEEATVNTSNKQVSDPHNSDVTRGAPADGGDPLNLSEERTKGPPDYAKERAPANTEGLVPKDLGDVDQGMRDALQGKGEDEAAAQQPGPQFQGQQQGGMPTAPRGTEPPGRPRPEPVVRPEDQHIADREELNRKVLEAVGPEGPKSTITPDERARLAQAFGRQGRQGMDEGGAPPGGKTPPPGATTPPNQPKMPKIIPSEKTGLAGLGRSVKRIFAPTTLKGKTPGMETLARDTGNEINRIHGKYNQMLQQGVKLFAPHRELLNNMSGDRKRMLNDRAMGGNAFPDFVPTAQEERLLADNKKFYQQWEPVLKQFDPEQKFRENYLPGMYKEEELAKDFYRRSGPRGDNSMAKEKKFATHEEARNAGLTPLTNDMEEMAHRYGMRLRDYASAEEFKRSQIANGNLRYLRENAPGWERIRDANQGDTPLHAPEDLAAVYNNYVDRGLRAQHGRLYDAAQHGLNSWTMMELGLNGYHFTTMGHEGIADDMSRAVRLAASGKFSRAGEVIGKAPLAPYATQKLGKQVIADYLNPNHKSVAMDLMRDADVHFIGRAHAPETMASQRASFYDHTSEASVKSQLNRAKNEVADEFGDAWKDKDVQKALNAAIGNAARAVQTISHPLFDVYIPRMKAGAIFNHVQDFLSANQHLDLENKSGPDYKFALEQIRKEANSVDNRFGEAVMNHLFINRTLQHSAQLGMRAFGWAVNSIKEIGGGSYSAGMGILNSMTGKPGGIGEKLSLRSPHQDPRVAYILGFPMALAFASTVTQVAMTGEPPSSVKDMFMPRTGGKVPGYGGKNLVDERMVMPGYMKDVLGWVMHPFTEAYNKLNGLVTTSYETARGQDGLGRSFVDPKGSPLDQVVDRMKYFGSRMSPISVRNLMKGSQQGSRIPGFMTALGFHAPSSALQDSEGFKRGEERRLGAEFNRREKSVARQERQHGNDYQPRKSGQSSLLRQQ